MEWSEILKLYGPQAIPWIFLAYLAKWHLDRYDRDLEARIQLSNALNGLIAIIKDRIGVGNGDETR